MLGSVCSSCSTVNLPESKFCGQCGKVLSPASPSSPIDEPFRTHRPDITRSALSQTIAGERKHVTVLFSDLSGYTTLTQRLDPEEVKDIMARLLHEITNVVARYEGFIEKFAGDAVMAVFGAIRAHEDDAIRAIITAREIHERVESFSLRCEKQDANVGIGANR
jgi:class 3 adenylate cyclase